MTPLETSLYGSFSYPSPTGTGQTIITLVTSVAGSQQVTSSMWQLPRLFSPLLTLAMDISSTIQVAEIYQLATECQALDAEFAKQFQNLSGHMAHNATFSTITA